MPHSSAKDASPYRTAYYFQIAGFMLLIAIIFPATMLLSYLKIRRLGAGVADLVIGITLVALWLPGCAYEGARHLKHALSLRDGAADGYLGTHRPTRGNSATGVIIGFIIAVGAGLGFDEFVLSLLCVPVGILAMSIGATGFLCARLDALVDKADDPK